MAAINPDGTVADWNPSADNLARELAIDGDTIDPARIVGRFSAPPPETGDIFHSFTVKNVTRLPMKFVLNYVSVMLRHHQDRQRRFTMSNRVHMLMTMYLVVLLTGTLINQLVFAY